ncbi:MAG: maleylacetoacetate isomerase [Legionellales bacterium]|nr:maleylacetoacetate isomerase [Legionellales bacterium]
MLKLYSYYRSSASYRVRISLELKKIPYELRCIHLTKNGGQQHTQAFIELNPQALIPTLVDEGTVISQSLAIIEYLEECYPKPSLYPNTPAARALVRNYSQLIACDIHPLNNLRVLNYLSEELTLSPAQKNTWYHHWIELGFSSLETLLNKHPAGYCCYGDEPTVADICLIPQVYNAERFKVDMTPYPRIQAIYQHCLSLEPFILAQPESQPDYESPEKKSD